MTIITGDDQTTLLRQKQQFAANVQIPLQPSSTLVDPLFRAVPLSSEFKNIKLLIHSVFRIAHLLLSLFRSLTLVPLKPMMIISVHRRLSQHPMRDENANREFELRIFFLFLFTRHRQPVTNSLLEVSCHSSCCLRSWVRDYIYTCNAAQDPIRDV